MTDPIPEVRTDVRDAARRVQQTNHGYGTRRDEDDRLLSQAFVDLLVHLSKGFMTCQSGPDSSPRVVIEFKNIRDAQIMHNHLLGLRTDDE